MNEKPFVDALLKTFNFLFWYQKQDPNSMWGCVRISEAIEGARILSGMSDDQFNQIKKICLGNDDEERHSEDGASR